MTAIRDALAQAKARIGAASDSASLDAQVLLCEVLGVERAYLLAHPEAELTDDSLTRFEALVGRAAQGEPLPYILGRRAFYDRELIVTPDVLIPRPETELLLEQALAAAQQLDAPVVADIGTGSGALAVTFAARIPAARVYAVDVSPAALAVARRNAEAQGVAERVEFLQGDLLSPLIERGILPDIVMANLPYIAADEVPTLAVSRYEPHLALDGGPDGLVLIRRLFDQLRGYRRPGMLVLLEIGAGQGVAVLEAAAVLPLASAAVHDDYAGLDRIVALRIVDAGR
jgi:release factor glutamine methyltransferase